MHTDYKNINVVILAAGFGTRLRPITDTIPKVMVPIAPNMPLLEHTLLLLKSQGFEKFIFNLHYLPEVITNHFGDGSKFGVSIKYSFEEGQILETGGALKRMEPLIESNDFLLIYGDHLFTYDFRLLVDLHMEKHALATLALKRSGLPSEGDLAVVDTASDKIMSWQARPHTITDFGDAYYLNTGLDVLSKKILDYIPDSTPIKLDIDIIPELIKKGLPFYGLPTNEKILDIGTPEKYAYAKKWYAETIESKKKTPQLSIIMGTFNRATLIAQAVTSVQGQSFTDWELIIADDGSSDNTKDIVLQLQQQDPRLVYVHNAVNQGISKNYNTAFRVARGTFVAMIDDDDPWLDNEKLAKQIAFLEKNLEYVGCGGGVIVVNSQMEELYRYLKPETDDAIRNHILFSNPMANSTTLFRMNAAEKVGLYDASIRYSGDRDFWMKMGKIGKLYNFPIYFSYYTMSGENTSITKIKPHLKTSLTVMRRFKRDYPHYFIALFFNKLQYAYAFLPLVLRRRIHSTVARLKRFAVQ